MNLLLDTSVFLWFITGDKRLKSAVRDQIISPTIGVWLSPVSFWEICVKYAIGKLPLPAPPDEYIPQQRADHEIEEIPLTMEAVGHLAKLPPFHTDPFDRMLICQAMDKAMHLVTSDKAIRQYPVKTLFT